MLQRVFGTSTGRSLWSDLRSGDAGILPRLVLSLISALLLLSIAFGSLGIIESTTEGYVRDEHVGFSLGFTAIIWFASLLWIWWRFRRFSEWIRLVLIVIGIWIVAIFSIAIIVSVTFREQFFVASIVVLAIGLTFATVLLTVYQWSMGKRVVTDAGDVDVSCPSCGYSMVGLKDLTCPECGMTYTIDELIRRQEYDSVRRQRNLSAGHRAPVETRSGRDMRSGASPQVSDGAAG